jgi:hypothetical protein
MEKIYQILESKKIKIAICPMSVSGLYDPKNDHIYLNPTEDLLPVLIHECLHCLIEHGKIKMKPSKRHDKENEETKIEDEEDFIWDVVILCKKYLNTRHSAKLLRLLMENLTTQTRTYDKRYDIKYPR